MKSQALGASFGIVPRHRVSVLADSCVKAPALPDAVVPGLCALTAFVRFTGGVVAFSGEGTAENEDKITIRFS